MDIQKKYKPYTIPGRSAAPADIVVQRPPSAGITFDETPPFAEIEVAPGSAGGYTPVFSGGGAVPVQDETRALFYEMRQIARDDRYAHINPARSFYKQALFMRDYGDIYELQEPFSAYYPHYQLMGYGQLRTYFTWRNQVRRGEVEGISTSYVFVYIYELLHNIGVENPHQGLERLVDFWQVYRDYDPALDKYMAPWLKDYHVYYPLEHSFEAFVDEYGLHAYYPTVCGYGSGPEHSFDIFAAISKYRIKDSAFYNEETLPLLRDCFYYVLTCLRKAYGRQKRCFEDLVFYPTRKEAVWEPFGRALFYSHLKQPDRQVTLSRRESYTCQSGRWTYTTSILKEHGRQLVGYIMKEVECGLRQLTGFRHKLSANPAVCDAVLLKKLAAAGVQLPHFIQVCTKQAYAAHTRREVVVDPDNLRQIRRDALDTQEKLIIPEEAPGWVEPDVVPYTAQQPQEETQAAQDGTVTVYEEYLDKLDEMVGD